MRSRIEDVVIAATLAMAVIASPSCGRRANSGPPAPTTTVIVDNRSSFEMTIYVWRGAERMRLGTARAVSESRLPLPAGMVFGAATLRFQADPIGSTRAPISQEILVQEGDVIRLRIPPM
jgi:hypothetical protein